MRRLVLTRLAATIPLLIGVSTLVFLLIRVTPTDPIRQVLGQGATAEQVARMRAQLGYDRPLTEQYLSWLSAAARGDLGRSLFSGEPVLTEVLDRFPVTLSLVLGGITIAILIGLPVGIYSALRAGSPVDRVLTAITSVGLAIPSFWLALLLVLVFGVWLRLFPVIGFTPITESPLDWARGLVLPSLALGIPASATVARQARGAMRDALTAPYVQTLRAAGVPRRRIIYRYALRNAMIPVLAVVGWELGVLLAISFVVERAFGMAGSGSLLLDGVIRNDMPLVQGGVVFIACLVIAINLAVDIGYAALNPRVRPA